MDPNAALTDIRENVRYLLDGPNEDERDQSASNDAEVAYVLAEHIRDLDEWIRKGGFLPNAWANEENERAAFVAGFNLSAEGWNAEYGGASDSELSEHYFRRWKDGTP